MTMLHQVLFIHGGGENGYHADLKLKDSLARQLVGRFEVRYPKLPSDQNAPDFGWLAKIGTELGELRGDVILIGHSLGASMLLKYLSEREVATKVAGVFLLATPFWTGDEDWVQGLKLDQGFGSKLPENVPFFFYHCMDDKEVSFEDLKRYRNTVPMATFTELAKGGHQLEGNMCVVADDVRLIFS